MLAYAPRHLLRRGWADHWTPLEQMWVAERAHRSGRGYGAWPSTAAVLRPPLSSIRRRSARLPYRFARADKPAIG